MAVERRRRRHLVGWSAGDVLVGVAQEVLDRQLERGRVGVDDEGGRLDRQADLAIRVAAPERLDPRRQDGDRGPGARGRARPRTEAGQLEEVLDDPEEPIGVLADVAEHAARVTAATAIAEEDGVAEDRRDRGPELVRDQPEELVLDRVRGRERPAALSRRAASTASRSVTSTRTLTAPMSSPSGPRSGVGIGLERDRVAVGPARRWRQRRGPGGSPSARWPSGIRRGPSAGHRRWDRRSDPHHSSPSSGRRPQSATAASLKNVIRPLASVV